MVLEGVLICHPDALARVKERARLDPTKRSPVAYVDRHGQVHAPFDEALELARAFCAVEPVTALTPIQAAEASDSSRERGDGLPPSLAQAVRRTGHSAYEQGRGRPRGSAPLGFYVRRWIRWTGAGVPPAPSC